MPDIEPIVTVTSYRVSCLPADHPSRRYFTLAVTFKRIDDEYGFTVTDGDRWFNRSGHPVDVPVFMPEADALELAKRIAPTLTYRGRTVAEVLGGSEGRHG